MTRHPVVRIEPQKEVHHYHGTPSADGWDRHLVKHSHVFKDGKYSVHSHGRDALSQTVEEVEGIPEKADPAPRDYVEEILGPAPPRSPYEGIGPWGQGHVDKAMKYLKGEKE